MKLSDGEKLILVMLSELCQKLKVGNEDDAKLVQEAIYSGNLWGLKWAFPGIFHDSEPTEEMLHTTVDILDMWSFLERGHEALSPADKARVEKEAAPLGDVKFRGFDGNGEAAYISIARFLIEELDRFQEFEGRDLNSHMPCLDAHKRMLAVFLPLRRTLGSSDLNATQIISILKEASHPESRKAARP
jgi:uncharacterized protein YfbU (UPF0304 family)